MEEAYQLTQALPGVGWIEQPVQLGHGGAEAARKFAAAEPGPVHPSPRLHGELVNQEFSEVARVLVVLQGVVDVYGTLVPGFEDVCDRLAPEFLVDVCLTDPVLRGWPWVELRVRDREDFPRAHGELEQGLPIVHGGASD